MSRAKYKYYGLHQNLLRAPLFFKFDARWRPEWRRSLRRLVLIYEKCDGHWDGRGLRPTASEKQTIQKLLQTLCSRREKDVIARNHMNAMANCISPGSKARAADRALLTELFVQYRKAYSRAYDRADQAWKRTDFAWKHEFLAYTTGLVRSKDYTRR